MAENLPAGTIVGTLAAADANTNDSHTYRLAAGTGDTDNAAFAINGDTLCTAAPFDYETQSHYRIRIRVEDKKRAAFEKAFSIEVGDANDAPQVRLTSPLNGMLFAPGSTVPLWASANDQDGSVASCLLYTSDAADE